MASAELTAPAKFFILSRARRKLGLVGLCTTLAAFTLCTLDGGMIAPLVISAVLLLLAACYLAIPAGQRLEISAPAACLSLMALYGLVQTLWLPQKISYDGWTAVVFWLTAAAIAWLSTQLFKDSHTAGDFRFFLALLASAVSLLDLLEQASRTNRYYWLIPSRYSNVFGPFAYWNNFAQFVELALPVTLWLGLGRTKPVIGYVLLAALQIGAVVASGSRAGTTLVGIELLAGDPAGLPPPSQSQSPVRSGSGYRSHHRFHLFGRH